MDEIEDINAFIKKKIAAVCAAAAKAENNQ
jgi:hypothetical protein